MAKSSGGWSEQPPVNMHQYAALDLRIFLELTEDVLILLKYYRKIMNISGNINLKYVLLVF